MKRNLLYEPGASKPCNKAALTTARKPIYCLPKNETRPPRGRILYAVVSMLLVASSLAFGQQRQWDGSNTTTGTIYRDGPVGIGTTTPEAWLDIRAWIIKPHLRIQGAGSLNYWNFLHNANAVNDFGFIFYDRSGTHLVLNDRGNSSFPNSNVGIGTSFPENREVWTRVLDILGSVNTKLSVRTSTIDARVLSHNIGWWGAPAGMIIGTNTAHPLSFGTNAATRMTIDIDGNVGINTTNPTHTLSVNGSIRAKEVIVNTGWSDFVFKDDYALRPLEEVENYIKAQGHLPDVPSEAEVKENGVSLGEMQVKLLQKIEELTLYVIELKKENRALHNQVPELRQQFSQE